MVDDEELDDHKDQKNHDADNEIAADHELAERLDNRTCGGAPRVAVR